MENTFEIKQTEKENLNEEKVNITYEPVKGTPFTAVKQGEDHFILLGNYKVTDNYETEAEAKKQIKTNNWQFLMAVISVMIEQQKNFKA